jgi:hypothetical protein
VQGTRSQAVRHRARSWLARPGVEWARSSFPVPREASKCGLLAVSGPCAALRAHGRWASCGVYRYTIVPCRLLGISHGRRSQAARQVTSWSLLRRRPPNTWSGGSSQRCISLVRYLSYIHPPPPRRPSFLLLPPFAPPPPPGRPGGPPLGRSFGFCGPPTPLPRYPGGGGPNSGWATGLWLR